MAFRFLHAADLHLGSPLRGLRARDPDLAGLFDRATRRAFETLVDVAIEEGVAAVVIAGDVFDRDWKDWSVGQGFVRGIARLHRAGIRTAMIRGNHDAESVVSKSLPLPPGVAWIGSGRPETIDWDDLGLAVHGMSFPDRAVTENMVHRYPQPLPGRFNLGLLHTSLTDRPAHDRYAPCAVADLATLGYDYWALGHVHAREEVEREPWIVFPGNIQGRSVRETGEKTVALVTVDDGRVVEVRHRAVDAARWAVAEVDLSGVDTADRLRTRVEAALEDAASAAVGRPLAARIRLVGETPLAGSLAADPERLREELQAVAARVSDRIAIEKTEVALQPPAGLRAAPALDGFEAALAAALADPQLRAAVKTDAALVAGRLPARSAGPDAGDVADGDEILEAARRLLLARLTGSEG